MTTTARPIPPSAAAHRPWLAHYEAGVPTEVEISDLTVDGLLREAAIRNPDRQALIFFGARTSF
ncbi:MAG TPA: long-chain fatty acid--CoA ligase, partial [Candidatus Limnocylindria bacterium]|nr:long-chain fatty acid--CoA ligase [Candidatus Limnocylindria bacterium]